MLSKYVLIIILFAHSLKYKGSLLLNSSLNIPEQFPVVATNLIYISTAEQGFVFFTECLRNLSSARNTEST